MIRFLSLPLIAAALVFAPAAQAQSRQELAERIDATEVRIGTLEQQFLAGDPVVETLMRRLDELDYQVRELTSQTEQLRFENRQLRDELDRMQRQRAANPFAAGDGAVNGDAAAEGGPAPTGAPDDEASAWMREGLDEADGDLAVTDPDDPYARDRAAATGVLGGPASIAPSGGPEPVEAPDPEALYDRARAQLLDGDFDGAQDGFDIFVAEYPEHERAGEAWYWLGETYFVRSDLAEAADAYIASLRAAQNGPKAPDALVRLAASLSGLGRQDDACATLGRFDRQFPNASAESRQRAQREAVRARCA